MDTPEIMQALRPYRDSAAPTDGMVEVPQKELDRLCVELVELRRFAAWHNRLKSAGLRWVITAAWAQVMTLLIGLVWKTMSAGWHFAGFSWLGALIAVLALPFIVSSD